MAVDKFEKLCQIAVEFKLAVAVEVAPVQLGIEYGFPHRETVGVQNHSHRIFDGRRHILAVPQAERGPRTADQGEHGQRQPAIEARDT